MALDVSAEQHLGATCAQVHGTEHHDDWIHVRTSSSGVKFSNSFVEYWSGINEVQRVSQHESIPCDQYHRVRDVQEHFYIWKPESAASTYDSYYGLHSPQNCTSTHKGLSHENWMSNERYLDWKGKCFWRGDTDDVMSHEQWLIHGLFVADQEISYTPANNAGGGDKLWIVLIWAAIIALVAWVSISEYNDGTSGDSSPRDRWESRNEDFRPSP